MEIKCGLYESIVMLILTLGFTPSSFAQMMGPGRGQALMCPGYGDQRGLMRDPAVALSVKEIRDGVAIEWTSTDQAKVAAQRQMAVRMQREHQARVKTATPSTP